MTGTHLLRNGALAVGLAMLAGGCPPTADEVIVLDERFEDCVSCRWSINGAFEQVTTIHPGEHGLRFLGSTSMTQTTSITIYDEYSDGHWMEYTSNCDAAPSVWVQNEGTLHVFVDMFFNTEAVGDYGRVYANLPPIEIDPWTGTAATIGAVTVTTWDPNPACVIDNLRLVRADNEAVW